MKKINPLACALIFPIVLASCDSPKPPPAPELKGDALSKLTDDQREAAIAKGNEASAALMKGLGAQLKAAMESGGPVAAVTVCKSAATTITDATTKKFEGLTVSRTTLKPRNPANAPDETDRAQFAAWTAVSEKEIAPKPELRPDPDGTTLRFYKPIPIAEICLNCHGPEDDLKPELKSLLTEQYPEDQATGYQLGDLRGAFKVVIDPKSL